MKKLPVFYIACVGVMIVCILLTLIIPEIGEMTLLNEVFISCAMVVFDIMLIRACILVAKSKNVLNTLLILATIVVIGCIAGANMVNTVKDVAAGPGYVTLHDCTLERRGTLRGIFSLRYYLIGSDSKGNEHRLTISGDEYDLFQGEKEVTVLYYENTNRIIRFE